MPSPTSQLESVIIQAGAGAGKTTTLIRTFIENARQFKKQQGRYPRIVVTTFTRKATQELRERLFTEAYAQNDDELIEYLNRKSWVHISTIHGLLVPFLSRYGVKVGLNPELKVVPSHAQDVQLKRICKKIFQSNGEYLDLLEELSWKDLISHLKSYYTYRLTFGTIKPDSSEELKVQSTKIFEDLLEQKRVLAQRVSNLNVSESWRKYFDSVQASFSDWPSLEAWYESLLRKPPFKHDKPVFDVDIHNQIESFVEKTEEILSLPLLNPANWEAYGQLQKLFSSFTEKVFPEFLQTKFDSGQLTMSDLELMTLEVIRRDADCAESFAQEWDYWMVDEYQDTSPLQVQVLKSFISRSPHFVVGDPQQSIYLFRGARAEVFEEKKQEMLSQGREQRSLMKNYRSRHEIVHFFNELFPRLSSQFTTMQAGSNRQNPDLSGAHLLIISSEKVEEQKYSSEILTVMAQVQDLLQEGVVPDSIVILSRTNQLLSQFVQACHEFKIPVQCPSLSTFWNRREVLDLLQLTHFLLNPHNNVSFIGLLRSPWFYVADQHLHKIQDSQSYWKKAWEVAEQIPDFTTPLEKLKLLREKALQFGMSSALSDFLMHSDFLKAGLHYDSTGRREANIWKFVTDLRMRESLPGANLIELLDEILVDESTDVENTMGEATPIIEPNRVTLMTIHASKGLQFDHVFVVGLGQDLKPTKTHAFSFDEDTLKFSLALKDETGKMMFAPMGIKVRDRMREREVAESLRVFYVALTRARESLWLSSLDKPKKNSIWAQIPLNKEEGLHKFDGGFYQVQRVSRVPQVMENQSLNRDRDLAPLLTQQSEKAGKKSVTGLLQEVKPLSVKRSAVDKIKALEKAQRGTSAHRIFEALALRKGEELEVRSDWKKAVEFIQNLQNPPMQMIFEKGHPEWGFAVKMDEYIMQGSIDIWAELDDKVFILDYKTGSSAHVESAFEQMKLYSHALKKMKVCSLNKPHIAVAIFPFEEKVLFRDLE